MCDRQGIYSLSLSHTFGKNFVKPTFLLKSWFDELFLIFPHFAMQWKCTLRKLQNFTATIFPQKFRQIIVSLNWFDGKKFAWRQWIFRFSTLWNGGSKIPWFLLCTLCYSVWYLVVPILFEFFQSQNHFSLDWLFNLQSNTTYCQCPECKNKFVCSYV